MGVSLVTLYSIFFGLPLSSIGGLILNRWRTEAHISARVSSAKKRPGQILQWVDHKGVVEGPPFENVMTK